MKIKLLRKFRRILGIHGFLTRLKQACLTSKLSDSKKYFHYALTYLRWLINHDGGLYRDYLGHQVLVESYIWRKLDKKTSTFDILPQGFVFRFKQKYQKHSRKYWTSSAKLRRAIISGTTA